MSSAPDREAEPERYPAELPVVVIIGRPNVGKSTLFNRLVGRRRAITDVTAGVTRDTVETPARLGNLFFTLVDTGGISDEARGLQAEVSELSRGRLAEADAVLLVMDVTEVTPLDELVVQLARPHSKKVVLVVNKVDSESRDDYIWSFHSFGFASVVGVSAAHGRGIDELTEALARILPVGAEAQGDREPEADLRLLIIGKPNTGKSTLLNRLVGRQLALVSDVPGTTRDPVEGWFERRGRRIKVVDTAGIRRKGRVSDDVEYYSVNRAIAGLEDAEVAILMIDAGSGLTDQDKKIAYQAAKRGRGIVLALNKWDDLEPLGNRFEAVRDRIRFQFGVLDFAPVIPLSARTGYNVDKVVDTCLSLSKQLAVRVDTSRLNAALERWTEATPPPTIAGRRFKARFMTQVGTLPTRFVLFVNRVNGFPASYVGYIRNSLRKTFGLEDIPLDVVVRARG